MADLRTRYLGLRLSSPLVVAASPLTRDVDCARTLEAAGAGAVVMDSLFEEEIIEDVRSRAADLQQDIDRGEGETRNSRPAPSRRGCLDDYLDRIATLKATLGIPVIASLNGVSASGWLEHARFIARAGADALELNLYAIPADPRLSAEQVEAGYLEVVRALRRELTLPLAVKIGPQFTAPLYFARRLAQAGADAVVIFNRFYQPDIDLLHRTVVPRIQLSQPQESLLRVRWAALMAGRVDLEIAVTGGFHRARDVIKALLAGAQVVQMASALLERGPEALREVYEGLEGWMEEHEHPDLDAFRGAMSYLRAADPGAYERANYREALQGFSLPSNLCP